jgi:SAM-dependent methyltransferase
MISYQGARKWIDDRNAWDELAQALGLASGEEARQSADEVVVWSAFGDGAVKSPALREKLHAYPIPDIDAAGRYSDATLLYHLGSGLTDARSVSGLIQRYAGKGPEPLKILDFSCGLGRLLRYMVQFAPQHQYVASEVNPKALEWLKGAYPQVNILQAGPTPPLDLPGDSLDAAYCFSIFTHYSEPLHEQWLEELARVLRPGGLLVLTIHGYAILNLMATDAYVRTIMRLGEASIDALRETVDATGYAFYLSYFEPDAPQLGVDGNQFGMAFISPDYVLRHWTSHFDVVWFDPGAVAKWQDFVVLRCKPQEQWGRNSSVIANQFAHNQVEEPPSPVPEPAAVEANGE